MKKGVFTAGTAALLFLGFFTTQALAQDFCKATHSGTSTNVTSPSWPNNRGYIGDYHYELWYDYASPGSATFYSDGSMSCAFQGAGDYLCRSGLSLQSDGKTYSQYSGDLVAEYKLVKKNVQNVNYSYVGVYGWMENVPGAPNGLVEYYIVDNTLSQYMPGDWVGNEKIATNVSIDGGTYNVYRNTRTGPAIGDGGDRQFYQYFSVRSSMRDCGTINISAHMKKWEELGLKMGKLYEAKVLGEAGGSSVSGEMDFPHAKVYIANGSTPNSSSSTVQSSSSQNLSVVGEFPGTIEFEDFQASNNEFNNYGSFIGGIDPGTWVEFKVDVKQAGTYDFELLAASGVDNASTVNLSLDGSAIGSVGVKTADWDRYETFSGTTTSLKAGEHTFRVTFTGGYVNADKITFTKHASPSSSSTTTSSSSSEKVSSSSVVPPSSSSVPVVVVNLPGSIEFEDYQSTGGAELKKNATSLGSINPGAWVEYSVNFTSAGYYDFEVLAARQDNDGNKSFLTVSVDGEDVGTVSDILTTGWNDYKDFSGSSTKEITAGEHTLRVTFDYGWIDADKITFTKREISSSSEVPLSSSSSEIPSSSSEVPPSSSSEIPSSSSEVPPSSSSEEPSSSSEVPPSSSSVEPPLSSAVDVVLYSSSSFNSEIDYVMVEEGMDGPDENQTTEAIGNIRMALADRYMQVFDVQGRNLGLVRVNAGASLEEALFAKFHRPGIYLVKQGSHLMKVRVSR